MTKFSNFSESKELMFRDLIQNKYSFDYLGGMFLSIFSRSIWIKNAKCISADTPGEKIKFSNLDNTFPHTKIFANGFMEERAYYSAKPLIVAVGGVREWTTYYPLIRTFRLLDLLNEFRRNGLGLIPWLRNKNSTVKHFAFDWIYYLQNRDNSFPKIVLSRYLLPNLILPNLYISVARLVLGRFSRLIRRFLSLF
jgi:hypothetical protein